mmetsp:Transcript_20371/g.44093  ORF Transcript_20371/g.44093 Transcript_20371/m.44093 type:complete len:218 (-) Transcript_20371:455-1108(-)
MMEAATTTEAMRVRPMPFPKRASRSSWDDPPISPQRRTSNTTSSIIPSPSIDTIGRSRAQTPTDRPPTCATSSITTTTKRRRTRRREAGCPTCARASVRARGAPSAVSWWTCDPRRTAWESSGVGWYRCLWRGGDVVRCWNACCSRGRGAGGGASSSRCLWRRARVSRRMSRIALRCGIIYRNRRRRNRRRRWRRKRLRRRRRLPLRQRYPKRRRRK